VSAAPSEDMLLVRPSWARLKYCDRRDAWLFLVPERVLFPCPITVEILQRIEKPQRLSAIARAMAAEYDAPEAVIQADIAELVSGFVEKGYVKRIVE
jgi:pyrroloquinoline quinone biosynthesis protein D